MSSLLGQHCYYYNFSHTLASCTRIFAAIVSSSFLPTLAGKALLFLGPRFKFSSFCDGAGATSEVVSVYLIRNE